MPPSAETRFGTVALAGQPNVGKSTLLNALVGEQLAIVSAKPQSTRGPVVGVRSEADIQLVFIDPPGLLQPCYLLQQSMLAQALDAIAQADGILYLHPLAAGEPPPLASLLPPGTPLPAAVLTVLTMADRDRTPGTGGARAGLAVSTVTGQGMDRLVEWCRGCAQPGPFRYAPEDVSTQPVRFFVEEFLREAAFELLEEELPYAVAAQVDEFREGEEPVYIRVTLYVERESQKRMIIGSGGRTIKALGELARSRIEALLSRRVYLDLWVKVLAKWRRSETALRRFGFPLPARKSP